MNVTLNAKEVSLGQDCTAELGIEAPQETGQRAEGTATRVAEVIPVTDLHQKSNTESHPETATDPQLRQQIPLNPYHNMYDHQDSLNTLHINTLETPHIPREGTLTMDTAQDGQTIFLITFHFET